MIPEEAAPALIPCIGCGLFVLIVLMNIYARTNRVSSFMVVLASLGLAVFPWGLPLATPYQTSLMITSNASAELFAEGGAPVGAMDLRRRSLTLDPVNKCDVAVYAIR
jgi:hypothetical protein